MRRGSAIKIEQNTGFALVGRPDRATISSLRSKYNENDGFCQGFLRFSSFLPFDQIKKVANFVLFISNFQGFWSVRRHKNFTFYTKFMMIFLRFATGGFEAIREAWKQVCGCLERCGTKVWRCRKSGARKEKVRVRRQRKKDPIQQVGSYERAWRARGFRSLRRAIGFIFRLIPGSDTGNQ